VSDIRGKKLRKKEESGKKKSAKREKKGKCGKRNPFQMISIYFRILKAI